ncbi:PucR family transcriptional regulator ligand-binding domain-containing protein [Clostridium cadaveris]|uniref:PucR family transcriptional regulator ligand-binding domain-containing protein n=1 Tax=Clostridium cadaveris TaxID=1529 RepID=UPI0015B3F2E1|nr:PucR family transcriptional regulator ligand-binding domain-containing protein [Clostridium cadaveris]
MNVKELLSLKEFQDYEVICGEQGLKNEVRAVTVMDALDIRNWVKGGEVLLTSGYILYCNIDSIANIVRDVHEAKAAALFIKLGRFLSEVPEEAVKICNDIGFPIIKMPKDHLFLQAIQPAFLELLNQKNNIIATSERIHTSFINIVINGGGICEIVDTLGELLKRDVIFIDNIFNKTYKSKDTRINFENMDKKMLEKYFYYDVNLDNRNYGHIIVSNPRNDLKKYELLAVQHASTVIKLSIQKKLSNRSIEERYRDGFVQDIILNNIKSEEEVVKRGETYGWILDKSWYTTIIIDIDNTKIQYLGVKSRQDTEKIEIGNQRIFRYCAEILNCNFKDIMYTKFTDSIVFIIKCEKLCDNKSSIVKVLNELKNNTYEKFKFTLTIGIGKSRDSITKCHEAYLEAQKCVKISRRIYKNDKIMLYEELGVYNFLYEVNEIPGVKNFYKEYIDRLISYDNMHNTELMKTLIGIVENGWNLKETSKTMYIHYNTLKNRYKKIEEVSELKLHETKEKLNMELAVKLYLANNIENLI